MTQTTTTEPVTTTVTAPDPALIQQTLQLGTGYIVSAALWAALRAGVPEQLAAGPRTAAEIARATGSNEDALYRLLRALSMVGLFSETAPRTFALTASGQLLRPGVPGSVYDLLLWMADPMHFQVYAETAHSITTGLPAGDKVFGMPVFEYLAQQPALSASFNNAMTGFSASVVPAVLDAYDFTGIGVLVDIAGGHGMVLGSILQRYPSMRGVLFDLEHVLAGQRLGELGVRDRCDVVAGDFFASVPAGDAYIMKHIIHDWDDEKATVILKNIRQALEGVAGGRVLLVEAVIQSGDQPDMMKLIDLEMLLLPGGRERSAEEFAALFARAGFALTRIVPTASPLSVVEARPV